MRRLLLAAAVSVPIAVVAAIQAAPSGKVVDLDNYNTAATTSYVNAAQCADSETSPLLNLQWSIVRGSVSGTAHYQLYAANEPSSKDDDANYCPVTDDTAVTPNEFAGSIGSAVTYARDLESLKVSGKTAVALAHKSCAADGDILYVCAHLVDEDSGNKIGYARGKFIVQITAPNAPTLNDVGPASETSLFVSWTAPGSGVQVDHYVAVATAGAEVHRSESTQGTSVTLSGLTQGTVYSVVVYAYSLGGNESPASGAQEGTPGPVYDFWETYKNAGGRDDGGCASGTAGPLALLAVAALLRLRRRK